MQRKTEANRSRKFVLVEKRVGVTASDELWLKVPEVATAIEEMDRQGYGCGVWWDGKYYLFGTSRFDKYPETVQFALTPSEYRRWKKGEKPSTELMEKAFKRVLRLGYEI